MITVVPLAEHVGPVSGLVAELVNRGHDVRAHTTSKRTSLLVGVLTGWLGLLSPASSVIASISNIGFIGFFVFMLSMGIALLRRRSAVNGVTQASAKHRADQCRHPLGLTDPQYACVVQRDRWRRQMAQCRLRKPAWLLGVLFSAQGCTCRVGLHRSSYAAELIFMDLRGAAYLVDVGT